MKDASDAPTPKSGRRVLVTTTLGLTLVMLNASSVQVALPSLSTHFDVDARVADWFLVSYMLATTASTLVFGRIADIFGRRKLYLGGLVIFLLLSAACVVAPNAETFIALRTLQGIAAATTVTSSAALLADTYAPGRLAQALSINLMAAAAANTLGPGIGGLVITALDWRAMFLLNIPFGITAILVGVGAIREPSNFVRSGRVKFDIAGTLLSGVGITLLLLGVNSASVSLSVFSVASISVGLVVLVLFVHVERRTPQPLLNLDLLRGGGRGLAYGTVFLTSFNRAGMVVLVVLVHQTVLGRSAAEAGMIAMALALGMTALSPLAGRLSRTVSVRALSVTGTGLCALGSIGVTLQLAVSMPSLWVTVAMMLLIGAGTGVFTSPNTASILSGIPSNRRASANAIRSLLFNSAQTLGTAATLSLLGASGVASYASLTVVGMSAFVPVAAVLTAAAILATALSLLRRDS